MLFFKQKTADGVRISDWSSYVCSSDLLRRQLARAAEGYGREISARYGLSRRYRPAVRQLRHRSASALLRARTRCRWRARRGAHREEAHRLPAWRVGGGCRTRLFRSPAGRAVADVHLHRRLALQSRAFRAEKLSSRRSTEEHTSALQ